jgi:hypothetical protein
MLYFKLLNRLDKIFNKFKKKTIDEKTTTPVDKQNS